MLDEVASRKGRVVPLRAEVEVERLLRATGDAAVDDLHVANVSAAHGPPESTDLSARLFTRRRRRQTWRYDLATAAARGDLELELYSLTTSQLRWRRREAALLTIARCVLYLLAVAGPVAIVASLYTPEHWHVLPVGLSMCSLGSASLGASIAARRLASVQRGQSQRTERPKQR